MVGRSGDGVTITARIGDADAGRPVTAESARGIYPAVKRVADVTAAGLTLILLSPVWCIVAVAVALDSPGPVLFRQVRVGRGERPFTLYKFRTMRWGTPDLSTEEMARRSAPSPITRVGKFLRRSSLDELPQLVNVLKGEMSVVGPRPSLPSQTGLNDLRRDAGVADLLPGLTGWAQVNGRDDLGVAEKARFDAEYRAEIGLAMDLRIVARTASSVCSGRGSR